MGTLKVNTNIQTPKPVRDNTSEITPETIEIHKNINFYFDIMFIIGISL